MLETITNFLASTGISRLFASENWWQTLIMFAISFVLVYLAIGRGFEPLLLLPIAIGMFLTNLPGGGMFNLDLFIPPQEAVDIMEKALADGFINAVDFNRVAELCPNVLKEIQMPVGDVLPVTQEVYDTITHAMNTVDYGVVLQKGGLLDLLYLGVKLGIYPSLIFIGIGAMTDFSPLISNPKSLLIGAGAQLGVFVAFAGALLLGFTPLEASSIGIIGGADGPTAILVTKTLAPALLGAIAIAAY